ncbi:hypothetical protein P5W99_29485 [Paraburkholderia sp. A3BS-1L]|uniref:hypothetical protein n=1 Tax=Paraburkholderia sp. A3BS-1L TaxID=3028375 RepID=UPI003DAA3D0E
METKENHLITAQANTDQIGFDDGDVSRDSEPMHATAFGEAYRRFLRTLSDAYGVFPFGTGIARKNLSNIKRI